MNSLKNVDEYIQDFNLKEYVHIIKDIKNLDSYDTYMSFYSELYLLIISGRHTLAYQLLYLMSMVNAMKYPNEIDINLKKIRRLFKDLDVTPSGVKSWVDHHQTQYIKVGVEIIPILDCDGLIHYIKEKIES